jgi:hypothetical protein
MFKALSGRTRKGLFFKMFHVPERQIEVARAVDSRHIRENRYLIFGDKIFFPYDNCGARGYN